MKIKNNVIMFALITIPLLFGHCGKNDDSRITTSILKYVQRHEDSIVTFQEFTKFDWDSMYVFNEGSSQLEVNEVLKINFKEYEEFARIIILKKKNKIVHHEHESYNPEKVQTPNIWFQFENPLTNYMVFEKSKAKFIIDKDVIDGGVYYKLKQNSK